VTSEQSKKLKIGSRVYWMSDRNDAGTVLGKDWSSVVIKWDSRGAQSIMHNDMTKVSIG
jgi:hypothetical protein